MSELIVFGADFCAGCKTVKDTLKSKGIEFAERDVNNVDHMEEAQKHGVRSIPTVVYKAADGTHIFTGASKMTIDSILLHVGV
ncbi:Glutaredoxin [compost metagenome]